MIEQRPRGTDISWTIPIVDADTAVNINDLDDYFINVFYWVGQQKKPWLKFAKTEAEGILPILVDNPATGELTIVIPRAISVSGPLGTIAAEVVVVFPDTSGNYADNKKYVTVLNGDNGHDVHVLCNLTPSVS